MRHSRQPTLSAPGGLTLRPWLPGDASILVTAYGDPAIQQWHRRNILSEDEARELIVRWNYGWSAETHGYWLIVRDDTAEPAGRVSLGGVDLDTGTAELGYWVLPTARGYGIATSAVIGLSRWALGGPGHNPGHDPGHDPGHGLGRGLGLHRLELAHSVANTASCRVADRAGFPLEGTKHGALLHADGWHDMHLHARVRDD